MEPAPARQLLQQADALSEEEFDQLPFGMIQLDRSGRILKLNAAESALGGVPKHDAIGRSFFEEVAPCTNVQEFHSCTPPSTTSSASATGAAGTCSSPCSTAGSATPWG